MFTSREDVEHLGFKGVAVAGWLEARGLPVPAAPNTWAGAAHADASGIWVARLGSSEFLLEDRAGSALLDGLGADAAARPSGVYPVLREDAAFLLSGQGSLEVLAQVCNVNFAAVDPNPRPVIMTTMIGVSVLVAPREFGPQRQYQIWCDPTFGHYLGEQLRSVVIECGNNDRGVSA